MKHISVILLCLLALPAFGATCKISQYEQMGEDVYGRIIPAAYEDGATPVIEVSFSTSTASSAFAASTKIVRIICDAKAHFEFGTAPTATTNDPYVPADAAEYWVVRPGDKVAFVAAS